MILPEMELLVIVVKCSKYSCCQNKFVTENSSQSTNLLKLESGEFAIDDEIIQIGQPTKGKLLINSSALSWSPSTAQAL